jgi:hypothetical protein
MTSSSVFIALLLVAITYCFLGGGGGRHNAVRAFEGQPCVANCTNPEQLIIPILNYALELELVEAAFYV